MEAVIVFVQVNAYALVAKSLRHGDVIAVQNFALGGLNLNRRAANVKNRNLNEGLDLRFNGLPYFFGDIDAIETFQFLNPCG